MSTGFVNAKLMIETHVRAHTQSQSDGCSSVVFVTVFVTAMMCKRGVEEERVQEVVEEGPLKGAV
jgi:hypothetical protein